LHILGSKLVKASQAEQQVLKKTIQAEQVALDIQGVRERVLHISRLEQFVAEDESRSSNLVVRWLIAQLKVNLRPLWTPTAEAIGTISRRFGEILWSVLFEELQAVRQEDYLKRAAGWLSDVHDEDDDANLDDITEDERSWRDPSAHKVRINLVRWTSDNTTHREIIKVCGWKLAVSISSAHDVLS